MKKFIKYIKSIFSKYITIFPSDVPYCNDPIVIEELSIRTKHKNVFFDLYIRCALDSDSQFPIYIAKMVRQCRGYMLSLPFNERQSFIDFCLSHKVDISEEAVKAAMVYEGDCNPEYNDAITTIRFLNVS